MRLRFLRLKNDFNSWHILIKEHRLCGYIQDVLLLR